LGRLGWTELDLAARRKNATEKLAIAARLRKETTLAVKDLVSRSERPIGGNQWRRTWNVKSPPESIWEHRKAQRKTASLYANTGQADVPSLPSNALGI
jgi:hypothetical protein